VLAALEVRRQHSAGNVSKEAILGELEELGGVRGKKSEDEETKEGEKMKSEYLYNHYYSLS
jgi:hypothetical protein